jgi:predicted nucleic acid-binding protein
VVVKWVLPDPDREAHVDQALRLLDDLKEARIDLLQPPHWLAEAAAVVTRLSPDAAEPMLDLLDAMEIPVAANVATLKRACRIARDLNHHLFDTFYHAVALEHDALLVTADNTYLDKAKGLGGIVALETWGTMDAWTRESERAPSAP